MRPTLTVGVSGCGFSSLADRSLVEDCRTPDRHAEISGRKYKMSGAELDGEVSDEELSSLLESSIREISDLGGSFVVK